MSERSAREEPQERVVVGTVAAGRLAPRGGPREGANTVEGPGFEALFAAHYGTVHGILYRLVGDQADDLAQEAFWRLYQAWPEAAATNARAWLCRVALNLGYNALRSARRRERYEALFQRWREQDADRADPAAEAGRTDEAALVRAALARLRPREAQLLAMRAQGLTYREIAAVLGVAPGSVGTLLCRAEEAFRRAYAPAEGRTPGRSA